MKNDISGIANWKSEDGWKNYSNDRNVQIDVHGTGTMKIQVPVFKYDNVEEWIMYDLDYYICDLNGYEIAHAYYYPEIEGQTGSYRYYEADQTFDFPWDIFGYNGEADYKVTNAPYADDTAPSEKGPGLRPAFLPGFPFPAAVRTSTQGFAETLRRQSALPASPLP